MTTELIDRGGDIKTGEELDIQAIDSWLKQQFSQNPQWGEVPTGVVKVSQYSGGASNWTYRLLYYNHDLILRRPPAGTKAKSAHDMGREFKVQAALYAKGVRVPQMLAMCTDHSIIGCDFYVMRRISGIIARKNLPRELNLSRDDIQKLCHNVIDALISIHQFDYHDTPIEDLGRGSGYCQRQVSGWDRRYAQAKTPNVPSFQLVRRWLKNNTPADSATCVIHNDWRFDNLILNPEDPKEIIGILDWEMATLGDPLMDLGSALAYWVQVDDNWIVRKMRRQPTHLDGMLTRRQVVDYYLQKTQIKIDNWAFYEVFGMFRLAAILQQIYYRYHHQQTQNPEFKTFWILVHVLHLMCLKRIFLNKIGKN